VVVVKFSRGEGWREVDEFGKERFKNWRIVKPRASRGDSREGFFFGENRIE
jgi:23S rRNA U2552 (ribose-2'-O)-methylase RlmE/FtsJ